MRQTWRGLLPPALTFPRPTLPRKQPFVLVNMRQRHFFKMAMTMMSFPHSYHPPSYSDNTTIMLAIVFRRPSPIPDVCARERPAENR